MMDSKQAANLNKAAQNEVQATRRLMRFVESNKDADEAAAFDSMLASTGDRDTAMNDMPLSFQRMINSEHMRESQQAIFDGIQDGIAEYRRRNGGDAPSAYVIAAGLTQAAAPFGTENQDAGEHTFDSLTLSHHEALSVVPAATQVAIAYGIATALPLVTMLPNPMGSNELPIVFGSAVASSNMGVMRRGDLMDGDKAGMPYLENRHVLTMDKGATGAFSVTSHVCYTAETAANKTVKFVADTTTPVAPFLGGRVAVFVKGIEVANDKHRNHPTTGGVSTLQPLDAVTVGSDTYKVTSATANLDTHKIDVQFDLSAGVEPGAEDVTVELIFDYERKDGAGNYILQAPGTDMEFLHRSIYAYPSRARSTATIDAITQLANELGINWYAAAQTIVMQRYYLEQNGRLLRTAVNMCLANQNPNNGRLITFDFTTNGVSPTNISDALSKINLTLGTARTRLSKAINLAISGYDIYVSTRGATFFSALDGSHYETTDAPYGDQYSIYRIGKLKNTGANVYYIPDSLGVFNEDNATTTAHALVVPRSASPAQAPFIGMVSVPPMVLSSNANAFDKDVATYSRMAAEVNPIPRYSNQFILIEMINLPNL